MKILQRSDLESSVQYRKLQRTANGTFFVSLPKKTIKEMKLSEGKPVAIIRYKRDNNFITLVRARTALSPEETIDATFWVNSEMYDNLSNEEKAKETEKICRVLVSLYLTGYGKIYLKPRGENAELPTEIRDSVKDFVQRRFLGAQFLQISKKGILLRVYSDRGHSLEDALKQMRDLSISMHTRAIGLLRDFSEEEANDIILTDDEVNKLYFSGVRNCKLVAKNPDLLFPLGLSNIRDLLGCRLVLRAIERVADHACRVAETLLFFKERAGAITLSVKSIGIIEKLSKEAIQVFEDSMTAFLDREQSFNNANNIVQEACEASRRMKEEERKLSEQSGEALWSLREILESIRRTVEYSSTIVELCLNLGIDSEVENASAQSADILKLPSGKFVEKSILLESRGKKTGNQ